MKFKIKRSSTTHWKGHTTIEAPTYEEAIRIAEEEIDEDDWIDDTESDGGYRYEEDAPFWYVAYQGQYARIHANSRDNALYQAQQDYNKPPAKRLLDWKDGEHDGDWDIIAG